MPILNLHRDSRLDPPVLRARLVPAGDGSLRLLAPTVGLYGGAPTHGSLVEPDRPIGFLEILGVTHHLLAPVGARGFVTPAPPGPARRPVAHDDVLLTLTPQGAEEVRTSTASSADVSTSRLGTVFRAPTSGRLYLRPGPKKAPFVAVGTTISHGQTIALIEVMKTFSRVHYGGDVPPRARIRAILATDESDVAAGDPLVELEPVEG